jgi:hypothetical protein
MVTILGEKRTRKCRRVQMGFELVGHAGKRGTLWLWLI